MGVTTVAAAPGLLKDYSTRRATSLGAVLIAMGVVLLVINLVWIGLITQPTVYVFSGGYGVVGAVLVVAAGVAVLLAGRWQTRGAVVVALIVSIAAAVLGALAQIIFTSYCLNERAKDEQQSDPNTSMLVLAGGVLLLVAAVCAFVATTLAAYTAWRTLWDAIKQDKK